MLGSRFGLGYMQEPSGAASKTLTRFTVLSIQLLIKNGNIEFFRMDCCRTAFQSLRSTLLKTKKWMILGCRLANGGRYLLTSLRLKTQCQNLRRIFEASNFIVEHSTIMVAELEGIHRKNSSNAASDACAALGGSSTNVDKS